MEYIITEEGVLSGFETKRTKGDLISIRVEGIVQMQVKKVDAQKTVLSSWISHGSRSTCFIFNPWITGLMTIKHRKQLSACSQTPSMAFLIRTIKR